MDLLFGKSGVPVSEAKKLISEGAIILDVRTREEFAQSHIPRSRNIPIAELKQNTKLVPIKKKIVVVCQNGGRSASAVTQLLRTGIDAVNLEGGLIAWQRAGEVLVPDE